MSTTNNPPGDGAPKPEDFQHMKAALVLARRGLGNVWPNPAVGCVLVRDGQVVGRGWTQPGGRPHAETEALDHAGAAARGAVAYVTLEPCAHFGKTPPCADALAEAGVSRVVVAVGDPDPRTAGEGMKKLANAGVAVTAGVCEDEAAELNAGFFLRIAEGRPLFTLKTATTLDGRIATRTGDSQWITGPSARAHAHRLRAEHDAVLVGVGTAMTDNPRMTCRLPGMEERSPIRIIADTNLLLPLDSQLVETASDTPTWIITSHEADKAKRAALADRGVVVVVTGIDAGGHADLVVAAAELGQRGLTRVLVEGGGGVAASLLRDGLVDRVTWFHAPRLIGGDGIPAAAGFGIEKLDSAPAFVRQGMRTVGTDILETYRVHRNS